MPMGKGTQRQIVSTPKFKLFSKIVTVNRSVPGHTRLPAYARGKTGTVIRCHGGWVFPDTNAHGLGEQPQHLYTVAFKACDLWTEGEKDVEVNLDLFEPYLLAAAEN